MVHRLQAATENASDARHNSSATADAAAACRAHKARVAATSCTRSSVIVGPGKAAAPSLMPLARTRPSHGQAGLGPDPAAARPPARARTSSAVGSLSALCWARPGIQEVQAPVLLGGAGAIRRMRPSGGRGAPRAVHTTTVPYAQACGGDAGPWDEYDPPKTTKPRQALKKLATKRELATKRTFATKRTCAKQTHTPM